MQNEQPILATLLGFLLSGALPVEDMEALASHLQAVGDAHMQRLADVLSDAYKQPACTRDDLADITDADLAFLNHCARCLPLRRRAAGRPVFTRGDGLAIIISHHD